YTIAQDNNLSACLFYLNNGFRIGGLDTEIYKGTPQEGKSDIFFYKDCSSSV
ncbi:MAG TPA: GNAT family N-acetyltransferase, partial [Bacilli bacterium]|nr:GNAT family N-acetyltransferase [Bacilli bacterium]